MRYAARELRRLFEVELYTGNPDAKRPKKTKETVIAFNHVEALRICGNRKAVNLPKEVCFVTWDEPPRKILDTSGPTVEVIKPTIGDTGWDF